MKTKMEVGLIIAIVVMCGIGVVNAYDASNSWTGTVNWIVPNDTTFTVSWPSGETTIDFDDNLTSDTQTGVEPDGQSNTTSTPIINVTNGGNVVLNITCHLSINASKPAWAVIKVSNTTSYSGATSFDTTAVVINETLAIGGTSDVYIWTDVTSATAGTTTRWLFVNSSAV